ncbi:hypothetical protein [Natrinema gelatinilyticum]|nr:hypothetical protein [Natrinema gelatinilyticum]
MVSAKCSITCEIVLAAPQNADELDEFHEFKREIEELAEERELVLL